MNLCCGGDSRETGHLSLPNGDVLRLDFDTQLRQLDRFVARYFAACGCGALHVTRTVEGDHMTCIEAVRIWSKEVA